MKRFARGATLIAAGCLVWQAGAEGAGGTNVVPSLRSAFILSFRSPDLTTNRPDERWGRQDGRLFPGRIISDFPKWLRWKQRDLWIARAAGRPIIVSLHVHSGFGTGLVTYTSDLKKAEAVNYPWLLRQLDAAGLNAPDVTVTVDTCNAQATAAHQLRRDLVPGGVAQFASFASWRRADAARQKMAVGAAYRLYSLDRVRLQLAPAARKNRANVQAVAYEPLTASEWAEIQCDLYGQKGVEVSTPALFNLLRLGPDRLKGTNTAHLLRDRLELRILGDNTLGGNNRELRLFQDTRFLAGSGIGADGDPWRAATAGPKPPKETQAATAVAEPEGAPAPMNGGAERD